MCTLIEKLKIHCNHCTISYNEKHREKKIEKLETQYLRIATPLGYVKIDSYVLVKYTKT